MAALAIVSKGAVAIAIEKSRCLRPLALAAARAGLSRSEISAATGVSDWLAGESLHQHRLTSLPRVGADHKFEKDGQLYYTVRELARVFGLTDTGLRGMIRRVGLPVTHGFVEKQGRVVDCYPLEKARLVLDSSGPRRGRLVYYRRLIRRFGVRRYSDLSEAEMATLLVVIDCLREGYGPTYAEINARLGYRLSFAHLNVPALASKGYLTQLPILNPKRGQPQYRYVIHKGPAKLVTSPNACPDCGRPINIAYPWFHARNGAGK